MPQGLKNAPSEIQNIVNDIFKKNFFQTKTIFLGYKIFQGTITPIQRSLEFANKFPNEIKDKNQLQRFLRCVNYVADFIPNVRIITPWNNEMSQVVIKIKQIVKKLPCLGIPNPQASLMVEIDVSELRYGGILRQKLSSKEQVVRYH
uniref:Enzymatic polyprotein n=1 Tax=Cajanus cajan TaxID=3821 RepID=A0A151RHL7_CAJCA|nr:Enzymatic polyprotein [Cajanus cajan]